MIELLRSLFEHQAWADSALLDAVRAHPAAFEDMELRNFLHHISLVQSFFLSRFLGQPLDEALMQVPDSLDELSARARQAHEAQIRFAAALEQSELERRVEIAPLGMTPTLAETMMQVILHSQGHRAQCATRLRVLGGAPQPMDYILWLKQRPDPVRPA